MFRPWTVIRPVDVKASKKVFRQGIEAVISEVARRISCQATVREMPIETREYSAKKLAYSASDVAENAATSRRKLKMKTMMFFFDFCMRGLVSGVISTLDGLSTLLGATCLEGIFRDEPDGKCHKDELPGNQLGVLIASTAVLRGNAGRRTSVRTSSAVITPHLASCSRSTPHCD